MRRETKFLTKCMPKVESSLLLEEIALRTQLLYLERKLMLRSFLSQSQSRVHLVLIWMVQDRELIGEELACHTLIRCHQQITLRKILQFSLQLFKLLKLLESLCLVFKVLNSTIYLQRFKQQLKLKMRKEWVNNLRK